MIKKKSDGWYIEKKLGPFYSEEEARQEELLYELQLKGDLKKIPYPKIPKQEIWEYYDAPLIGTYEGNLFCFWDREGDLRKYLVFKVTDLDDIQDFLLHGYDDEHSPPVLTYILRTHSPHSWFIE